MIIRRGMGQTPLPGQIPIAQAPAAVCSAPPGYSGSYVCGYSGPIYTPSGAVVNVNLSLQQLSDGLNALWGKPRSPTGPGFGASGYVQNVLQYIGSGVLAYDPTSDTWAVNTAGRPQSPAAAAAAAAAPSSPPNLMGPSTFAPTAAVLSPPAAAPVQAPVTAVPAVPDVGTALSAIPVWGWAVAVIAVILIASGGKR